MTTQTVETPVATRPKRPVRPRVVRALISAAIIIPVLWAALGLEVSWEQIRTAPSDMWDILKQMFPPDFSPEAIQRALPKIMESLWIAWLGTIMGAFFSFFLAFAAATNVAPPWMTAIVRQVLNAIRAVPELLVAMALIPVTGLGAWTGTLALGIHSIGTLGKLSSEVVEGSDAGPVEAISSSGGTRLQEIRFGIVPQVMPNIVAYWLYRFEINIRASAVLGVIGAGGIGSEILAQLRFRDFARAGTVLFLTIAVVLSIDMISARLRRRIITGHAEAGPIANFRKMRSWQRVLAIVAALAILAFTFFILYQFQRAQVAG
ncbi:MAG TPA: phosphonate ABC transporter, permease protein PhnE [Acidimicrobiia bacterium]